MNLESFVAPEGFPDRYGPTARERAAAAVRDPVRAPQPGGDRWLVSSPPNEYSVTVLEGFGEVWTTCTCRNGEAKGGQATCWHSAAVIWVYLRDKLPRSS